ncbi:Heavy-metal-associated domain-containing protein [Zostera marina]|uniref:Heavy-metal-associated domain-containing protein n=1 Tax=Zostera marina TaxID=29655 RepID=A0A0K9PX38_ZOSMR|nr:Heavy-metal-associated domain-containing protein [Zostera marina]
MATITVSSISHSLLSTTAIVSSTASRPFYFPSSSSSPPAFPSLHLRRTTPPLPFRRAVEDEGFVASDTFSKESSASVVLEEDQPAVSVPISPSDSLDMFFKAEGTMSESAVSAVKNALEEVEGISDLNVQVVEGIASVELTKETTVQATGVASNRVEIIQGSGFKLQALNLSFDDEDYATAAP